MFIRPCYKKSNGKKLAYWALVESYRTANGPRQRIVAYLGQLKDSARRGVKQLAEGKNTPEELWRAYIQLTEAEAAFRIQKSDLQIRPIWHQKEERVLSHILVCFLAYVLWRTLGCMVKRSGMGDEPRRVLDELSKINLVDVVLPTSTGVEIRKRCITRPTEHQNILLQHLGLNLPRQFKN